MTRGLRAAPLLVAALLLAGCGDGGGDVDPDRSAQQLAQQRRDVRSTALDLVTVLERRTGGTLATSSGQYRGCESAFNDQFKDFHYLAQARVDVADPVEPADLEEVLADAGLAGAESSEGPGGQQMVRGRKGDVRAVLTVVGGQPYVVLDVSGPCLEVPEDQRDEWTRKQEPSPDLR